MGRRILHLSPQVLPVLMGEGVHHYRVTKDALPDDTKVIDARFSYFLPAGLSLLLESAAWDGPADGEQIPRIDPVFTRIDPQT